MWEDKRTQLKSDQNGKNGPTPLMVFDFATSPSGSGEDCFSLQAVELVYSPALEPLPKEKEEDDEELTTIHGGKGWRLNCSKKEEQHLPHAKKVQQTHVRKRRLFARWRKARHKEVLRSKSPLPGVLAHTQSMQKQVPTQGLGAVPEDSDMEQDVSAKKTEDDPLTKFKDLVIQPATKDVAKKKESGSGSDATRSLSHSDDSGDSRAHDFQFLQELRFTDTFEMEVSLCDDGPPLLSPSGSKSFVQDNVRFQRPIDNSRGAVLQPHELDLGKLVQPTLSDLTADDDEGDNELAVKPSSKQGNVECRLYSPKLGNQKAPAGSTETAGGGATKSRLSAPSEGVHDSTSTVSGFVDPFMPVEFVQIFSYASKDILGL